MDNQKDILVNRVANSGIETINLEELYPKEEIVLFDIKDYLFKELILKEKDFRSALKEYDWQSLENKILLVDCSNDAIIPLWSFMLISANASPFAKTIWQGNKTDFLKHHFSLKIDSIDANNFAEKRVVIKGCSNVPVPAHAYAAVVQKLRPFAQSIMFGEPCSTVPIFKRPRKL